MGDNLFSKSKFKQRNLKNQKGILYCFDNFLPNVVLPEPGNPIINILLDLALTVVIIIIPNPGLHYKVSS